MSTFSAITTGKTVMVKMSRGRQTRSLSREMQNSQPQQDFGNLFIK